MAKQSGLHQIRGKVGEHSYYKQTGVASGLIRSINQGLSSRVKTGEEYANTRLNMQEFGQACQIAGQLGKMVTPKFRPMVLPFSQSKMAKDVLALIKEDTTAPINWGWRRLMAAKFADALASLNATAKYPFANFADLTNMLSTAQSSNREEWQLDVAFAVGASSLVQSIGADGVTIQILFTAATYTAPDFLTDIKGSLAIRNWDSDSENITDFSSVSTYSSDSIPVPVNPDDNFHRTAVVVIMPYRTIGGTKHILQEYCSFKAVEIPQPAV